MDEHLQHEHKSPWLALTIVLVVAVAVGAAVLFAAQYALHNYLENNPNPQPAPVSKSTEIPELNIETVLEGLDHPWDIAFLPDDTLLFTERKGMLSMLREGKKVPIATIPDVRSVVEGGLLGLAVDPDFDDNRFIYTCYNSQGIDIRVVRWKLSANTTALEDRKDIITDIPSNYGGRHSGCRMAFGPDGYLWIGTGDSAQNGLNPQTPQNPKSLGGKIVRVDRDGKAAPDNLGAPFDSRVYSYGHRNTQGIAFLTEPLNGIIGFSAEHGSTIDDEVNPLKKGNFGWDPDIAYTEKNISMTDKVKFTDAIDPTWRSGTPTQAPSGLAAVAGRQWKAWEGSLAVAMLKGQHLKFLTLSDTGIVAKEDKIMTDRGRLRDVQQGPDGSLYVSTDNGNNDKIIKLTPKQ